MPSTKLSRTSSFSQSILGNALISALFLISLISILATMVMDKLTFAIYQSNLMLTHDKARLYNQYATYWAISQLVQKQIFTKVFNKHGVIKRLPKALQHPSLDVFITSEIIDAQSRFNVNNLLDKQYFLSFYHLLKTTVPENKASQNRALMESLFYWLSPYQLSRGRDALLNSYLTQKPPYQPGYGPIFDISELKLIKDMTPLVYQKLIPWVTALPTPTPINLNTAPMPVLRSLSPSLSDTDLEEFLSLRGDKGFQNFGKVQGLLEKAHVNLKQVTLNSDYYIVKSTIKIDKLTQQYTTLLHRINRSDQSSYDVKILHLSTDPR